MPRSPIKPDPNTERIRRELRAYLQGAHGLEMQVERATGVKQYTISRFVTGRTKKLSEDIRTVCNYAEISLISGIDHSSDNARIQAALARVWDGKSDSAELLAVLIESLEPLLLAVKRYRAKARVGEAR